MRIIRETTDFTLENKSAVAVGKFDGLHLGHRKLLEEIIEQKRKGLAAVIFTFDPAPEAFFAGKEFKGLMSLYEKRRAFEKMGIDVLVEFPMNKENAAIEPERFVKEYLVERLKAAFIAAGTDISFGKNGAGDVRLLKSMAQAGGYRAHIIDKVTLDGQEISSTLIRKALTKGDMENVAAHLGAPYSVSGYVVRGRQLGGKLGMPTANLAAPEDKLLPPAGVYYSYAYLGGRKYNSITNIGRRPTVSEEDTVWLETYFYDFDKDIYGRKIVTELLFYKRPELKFDSIEALRAQIAADIADGACFHKMGLATKKDLS